MQQAGTIGSLFFYGRLQGREPGVNWFERLTVYANSVDMEQLWPARRNAAASSNRSVRT